MTDTKKVSRTVASAVASAAQTSTDNQVASIAARLRTIAGRVEKLGEEHEYAQIIHEVTWGFAHLDLSGLFKHVSEHDHYDTLANADDLLEERS
jgi:hypothetical protein